MVSETCHDAKATRIPRIRSCLRRGCLRLLAQAAEERKVRLPALARGQYPGRRLPRDVLSGLRSIGLWDAEYSQDWALAGHRNEGIELTFAECGVSTCSVSERDYLMKGSAP
jgi:hypothetical protein